MSEFLLILVLLVAGWLILSSLGMRDWMALPLGYIVGTLLAIVWGSVLVVLGLPTNPWVILGLIVSSVIIICIIRHWHPNLRDCYNILIGILFVAPLTIFFRGANLVSYHIDSFRYLTSSRLLADSNFGVASLNLLEKRGLSSPVIHSLSSSYGEEYVRSHGPILAIAITLTIVWLVLSFGRSHSRWILGWPIAVVAALLFVTNNRMIWNAFYINDHLIFGVALLLACSGSWILARDLADSRPAWVACVLVSLVVLVVTRPEGFIAGFLVVIPLSLSQGIEIKVRAIALRALGYSTFLWFGYMTMIAVGRGGDAKVQLLGPAIFGVVLVLASWLLQRVPVDIWGRRVVHAAEVMLWVGLVFFFLREPGVLVESLSATYQNQIGSAGSWGYSLVILGVLGLLALMMGRDRWLVQLRFPLTAFVPVFFLLAYLRGGAYRVGNGDSLNRMLMHVVPLLVVYIAVSLQRDADSQAALDEREDVPAT